MGTTAREREQDQRARFEGAWAKFTAGSTDAPRVLAARMGTLEHAIRIVERSRNITLDELCAQVSRESPYCDVTPANREDIRAWLYGPYTWLESHSDVWVPRYVPSR